MPGARVVVVVVGALAVASLALIVSGCAAPTSPSPSESKVPAASGAWSDNMTDCLEEKGWEVDVLADGGISSQIPDGQEEIYRSDLSTCRAKYGYDVDPVYTDDEARDIYAQVLNVAECLREKGFDPGEAPSEQTFVEQLQTGPGGWDPYIDLYPQVMDTDEYMTVVKDCPRTWEQ